MKIVASRTTAFVAGAWTTLSLSLFDSWSRSHDMSPQMGRLLVLIAVLLFWGAPLVIFVFGFDRRRWKSDYMFGSEYQAEFPEMMKRGLFCFLGGLVCSLALRVI